MKKTLQELTTELQTLCHEGYSNCEVAVMVNDEIFAAGEVRKVINDKDNFEDFPDYPFFVIEAVNE